MTVIFPSLWTSSDAFLLATLLEGMAFFVAVAAQVDIRAAFSGAITSKVIFVAGVSGRWAPRGFPQGVISVVVVCVVVHRPVVLWDERIQD